MSISFMESLARELTENAARPKPPALKGSWSLNDPRMPEWLRQAGDPHYGGKQLRGFAIGMMLGGIGWSYLNAEQQADVIRYVELLNADAEAKKASAE